MQHVWQPCWKRLHKKYIVHAVKQPVIQMVLGAMSAAGTTVAHNVAPEMTTQSKKCIKLKTKLQLRIFVDQCNIFMHDGATITSHKSKVVKNFLAEKNIRLLGWSGN